MPLRVQLQLRIVSDDDTVIRDEVILELDKSGDRLEAVGLESNRNRGRQLRLRKRVERAGHRWRAWPDTRW